MEQRYEEFLLVTQNVDGLHRKAGSERLVELHGNLWRVKCTWDFSKEMNYDVPLEPLPPKCPRCGHLLRPDVVWFGEGLDPDILEKAVEAAGSCDVALVVGTSAVVQPAASLPIIAKHHGAVLVEVNVEPTPLSPLADHTALGKASEVMPRLMEAIDRD